MQQIETEFEKKVLTELADYAGSPDQALAKSRRLKTALLAVGWAACFAAFFLGFGAIVSGGVVAGLAAVGGLCCGQGFLIDGQLKRFPVIVGYVDTERVTARLAELDSAN
jgi:hypothetical protein